MFLPQKVFFGDLKATKLQDIMLGKSMGFKYNSKPTVLHPELAEQLEAISSNTNHSKHKEKSSIHEKFVNIMKHDYLKNCNLVLKGI